MDKKENKDKEIVIQFVATVLAVMVASIVFAGISRLLPYIAMATGIAVGIHFVKEHYKREISNYLEIHRDENEIKRDNHYKNLEKDRSKEKELNKGNRETELNEISKDKYKEKLVRENNVQNENTIHK